MCPLLVGLKNSSQRKTRNYIYESSPIVSSQMKHVSTQTNKMVDVAMATVTAAETEEAIGVGSGSGDDSEPPDPELQV